MSGQMTVQQQFESGLSHHQAGRLAEAERMYRQVLTQQPTHADALHLLGVLAAQSGRPDAAVELIRRAIEICSTNPFYYGNLGKALVSMGRLDEAIAAYRQSIRLNPDLAESHESLGNALKDNGQLEQAIASLRRAVQLKPDLAKAHNNLGNLLTRMGQLDEAIAAYGQAIRLKPDFTEAFSNLGNALQNKGQLDEAVAACRQAVRLRPDCIAALCNLADALKEQGQADDAVTLFRQALRLNPNDVCVHSNLVLTLHYHPGYDAKMIHEELRLWNRQHAEPLKKFIRPHVNNRDPDRRLRLGYVSPAFGENPIGWFLLPLLANHDHQCVEVFAYARDPVPDKMTKRLGAHADVWRSLVGLSDAQAADLIRQDRIDVLVDLALHAANNGLLVFAHKPAPVQVTYLAYAGSSGLTTMDYRLSDPYLDPPGGDESVYSEQTLRLPQTYWCYRPVVDLPLRAPPALEKGFITFGCLNHFCKVNEPLLSLWARLLGAVPDSRLLLHAHEGSHRQRVLEHLQREGVNPQRVSFVGWAPVAAHFERYHSIDIALDTFPFGGGTTTCDALWMGVPVVSLAGKTALSRAGLSILSNVGLQELVADTPDQYVRLGVSLANDLPRLKELHSTLRQQMQASPLMDAPRFARNVEAAYRQMWRNWCQQGGVSGLQCPPT
jgi:predicted O-linked N-acetylglucosamine transferase (SPINDLY family)